MTTVPNTTRACPNCGRQRPVEEDFCGACGRYTKWTTEPEPVPSEQAPPRGEPVTAQTVAAARPADRSAVTLDVTVEGAAPRDDKLLVAHAAPGGQAVLTAHVRNIGTQVRTFEVVVHGRGGEGLPPEWVHIADDDRRLELNPFEHPGPSEGIATIVLRVPVENRWPAGPYDFAITIRSADADVVYPTRSGTLHVAPRFNTVATVSPLIASGRRRGTFKVLVINNGNQPIAPAMTLSDAEERCSFEAIDAPDLATAVRGPRERLRARMRPSASPAVGAKAMPTASPVVIAPGAKRVYGWAVRGPRHLIGWPVDHQIKIEVTVADQEPLPPLLVIFRQRPLIAWWLIPAILLLGALLLALYLIWPRKVDMPDMRGRTVNAAERQMVRTGLTAKPQVQRRVVPRVKAGTVVGQLPAPFARVGTGQKVIVTIAMPPAFTLIPDLRGYTWDRAEALLSHAHLKLGEVLPSKISLRKVIRQSPRAGRARSRGTAVDVVLAGPPLRVLPDVRCLTPKRAQAALERRGFRLKPVPEFLDPRKLSRSQTPPPHTRQRTGRQVQLFFTGAKPKRKPERCRALAAKAARAAAKGAIAGAVAFDDGHAVRLAGRPRIVGAGRQAAWSPDGALLALRSGPRIVIRRVGGALGSAAIATISTPGVVPSMPAFAPGARDRPVLAFLATRGTGTSSICLAAVVAGEVTPNCRQLPRIRGRALAWSPDAATILVTGARPELPDRSGVVRLTAVTPAAADGALWNVDRHLLRPRVGARRASVFDVAFEPSGATLALTTDVAASGAPAAPQIVLARADQELSLRGARWLGTPACQVAWSSDGARLAAVQSGDAAGCGSRPRLGRLVALALDEPHVLTEVTTRASRPAWRPAAAARGRDHP